MKLPKTPMRLPTSPVAVMLFILVILMGLGVPIAFCIGLSSLGGLMFTNFPLTLIPQRLFTACDSFVLLAVPLFILAGVIMASGGMSVRLIRFIDSLIGRVRGGLGFVSIAACGFFAAISGSGAATVAAVGSAMYPEMVKREYDNKFVAATIACGGTVGVVIPPSIPLIVYGVLTNTSIAALFFGGIIPGIIACLNLMVCCHLISGRRGYQFKSVHPSGHVWKSFKGGFLALLMPLIILGGIYGGIFTPTESAAVAVVYALIVCVLVYREMKFRELFNALSRAAVTSSMIMMLIATASLFSWLLTIENVPQIIAKTMLDLCPNKFVFLIIVTVIFLFLGMFLDTCVTILLLVPIFFPVAMAMGIDPVHFGLITVFNLSVGQETPPFGICLITAAGVSGLTIEEIVRNYIPYLLSDLFTLLLIVYIPQLTLLLPGLLIE